MRNGFLLGLIALAMGGLLIGVADDALAQQVTAVAFILAEDEPPEEPLETRSGVQLIDGEFVVPRNRLVKIGIVIRTEVPFEATIEIDATVGGATQPLEIECSVRDTPFTSCTRIAISGEELVIVAFSAGQLGPDEQVALNIRVLNAATNAPITDGQKTLSLRLAEAVVDLALEGPVTLVPTRPKQGDVVMLSFFIRNGDPQDAGVVDALRFKLKAPDPQAPFLDMAFLQVGCLIGTRPCSESGLLIEPRTRLAVVLRFLTASLPPTTPESGPYLIQIDLESAKDNDLTNNTFTVNFTLDPPDRRFSVTIQAPPPDFRIRQGGEVAVRFTVKNDTAVILKDNAMAFALEAQTQTQIEQEQTPQFAPLDPAVQPTFHCAPLTASAPDEGRCRFDLEPAQSLRFEVRFSSAPLSPGAYRLTLQVVPAEGSGETPKVTTTDRPPNAAQIAFVVVPGIPPQPPDGEGERPPVTRGPELRPIKLEFSPSATVVRGAPVVISATIKNSGNRDALHFSVLFSLRKADGDGPFTPIGTDPSFARLGVGQTLIVTTLLETRGLEPGTYQVKVTVALDDPEAAELDPNNNELIAGLTIEPQPEE